MSTTPNFTGLHALILHRPGDTTERLGRQLTVLGLRAEVQWLPRQDEGPLLPTSCWWMRMKAGAGFCPGRRAATPFPSWPCSGPRRRAASPGRSNRARRPSSRSPSWPPRSTRRWSWRPASMPRHLPHRGPDRRSRRTHPAPTRSCCARSKRHHGTSGVATRRPLTAAFSAPRCADRVPLEAYRGIRPVGSRRPVGGRMTRLVGRTHSAVPPRCLAASC